MAAPIHPFQAATLSPEALSFLESASANRIPASRLPQPLTVRANFQTEEDIVEEALIAKHNLAITSTKIANVDVLIIQPPTNLHPSKIVLNIHGGGFILGTARERTALFTAGELGITVYSINYTLAPEASYPTAVIQCLDVYRALVAQFPAMSIIGFSSSAGGQLMLSMLVRAAQSSPPLPLPAALAFYTPGIDLSGAGDSSIANDGGRDVVTAAMTLGSVQLYLGPNESGIDPKDPLFSPIYTNFKTLGPNFPPTVINTGTRDLLLSQAVRLY